MVDRPDDVKEELESRCDPWKARGDTLLTWPLERFIGALDKKGFRKEAFGAVIQVRNRQALVNAMESLHKDLQKSSRIGTWLRGLGIALTFLLAASAVIQTYLMWWVVHRASVP